MQALRIDMSDFIVNIVDTLNAFIWGLPAIVAIIGVGAFLTVTTRSCSSPVNSCGMSGAADLI